MFEGLINQTKYAYKQLFVVSLKISGVNVASINKILSKFHLYPKVIINDFKKLIEDDEQMLNELFVILDQHTQNFIFASKKIFLLFKYYKTLKHYKGKRIIFNSPLNGQRTHTNAKTIKRFLFKINIKKDVEI